MQGERDVGLKKHKWWHLFHSTVSLYARRERCWIKEAQVMATLPLHSFSVNLYARRESYNAHYCLCTSDARASSSAGFSYQDAHKFSTHTIPTQYLGLPLHVNSTHNQVKPTAPQGYGTSQRCLGYLNGNILWVNVWGSPGTDGRAWSPGASIVRDNLDCLSKVVLEQMGHL